MIATTVNALLLQDVLEGFNIEVHVISAVEIKKYYRTVCFEELFKILKRKNVVIFAGGTGNPYLQLIQQVYCYDEINADVMLKATGVEGVYTDDPRKNVSAKLYKN